jgi:hypothetical protein
MPHGTVDACGACGAAGRIRKAWEADNTERTKRSARAKDTAIRDCNLCDDDGRIETTDAAGNDAVINCTHHNDREYA